MSLAPVDRLFALRGRPPFDRVGLSELAAIAARMAERHYPAGTPLVLAGSPVDDLLVVVYGEALRADGRPAPAVLGLPGLLFGLRPDAAVLAGPEGATALALGREHLFTVIGACPELLAGVLAMADGEAFR